MIKTRVQEILEIDYPIVQGGLAHVGYSDLAAAVSQAGGFGQITAMSLATPEDLRKEIRNTKEKTAKPFGVNFALGHREPWPFIEVALEEGITAISVSGGNPEPVFRFVEEAGVKKLVLVAGKRQAEKAEAIGADMVIAVGQEGGGHLGKDDTGTIVLVPVIARAVKIPVLASGGIVDGAGLVAALALGAEGIEMGTRFVATKESLAHLRYKEALVNFSELDTEVIERSIGRPARALKSPWVEKILELEKKGVSLEEILPYISGEINAKAAIAGELEDGFAWAGQGIGLITDIPSVNELLERIMSEAKETIALISRDYR